MTGNLTGLTERGLDGYQLTQRTILRRIDKPKKRKRMLAKVTIWWLLEANKKISASRIFSYY
jgi:hypothetical protein